MTDSQFTAWMKSLEGAAPGTAPAADAAWWRAQLRARLAAEERVTRPVRIAERLAYSLCLVTAAVLVALYNLRIG